MLIHKRGELGQLILWPNGYQLKRQLVRERKIQDKCYGDWHKLKHFVGRIFQFSSSYTLIRNNVAVVRQKLEQPNLQLWWFEDIRETLSLFDSYFGEVASTATGCCPHPRYVSWHWHSCRFCSMAPWAPFNSCTTSPPRPSRMTRGRLATAKWVFHLSNV